MGKNWRGRGRGEERRGEERRGEERSGEERREASWGKMGDGESGGERERAALDGDSGRGVRLQAWFSAAV
ncbi:hypothetical protein Droror1_Dr00025404, partial [Drosera rotundifolia]